MKRIGLVLVLAAGPALAGESAPPPGDVKTIDFGAEQLVLGPFITTNYLPGPAGRSDPVNLVFLNTDPRAVRQQFMRLDGNRPNWGFLPSGANGCTWTDAMGYEQAAYLEPEGWVGSAVQLACATAASPLGREYRFHVRLFRSGQHTIGGAHFEVNIPGTAEHEVLSWEMARAFVGDEMVRLGLSPDPTGAVPVYPTASHPVVGGYFRTVRGPINAYVWYTQYTLRGNATLMGKLGLLPPPNLPPQDMPPVPIPATGLASVYSPSFTYVPTKSDVTLTDTRTYSVDTTKPFCGGESIHISGGPLTFTLRVQTNPSGKYLRTYTVSGDLVVTTGGAVQTAVISEVHRGMLTDNYGQVAEEVSQTLLPEEGQPGQSLNVVFGAGQNDYWVPQQNCQIVP